MIEPLAARLASLPGVVAVTLGGSRAQGTHRPDSDWDLGLYYRGGFDANALRALGYEGQVAEPGEWAPFVYGGAWLRVDGKPVDVLYRNLDFVDGCIEASEDGRFDLARCPGYVAGMPSYVLVGELSLGRVLHGELPRPPFPEALRSRGPVRWRSEARFALLYADAHEPRGDTPATAAALGQAVLFEAHARMCERGEWALNEKGLAPRAGLDDLDLSSVDAVRSALGMERGADEVSRARSER